MSDLVSAASSEPFLVTHPETESSPAILREAKVTFPPADYPGIDSLFGSLLGRIDSIEGTLESTVRVYHETTTVYSEKGPLEGKIERLTIVIVVLAVLLVAVIVAMCVACMLPLCAAVWVMG
jgi:hypothetical protein